METPVELATVDVAVTVIHCEDKILAVYNPHWGAFSLPMTKHRPCEEPVGKHWHQAAVRNVAETLGRTTTDRVFFMTRLNEWRQSDRDGVVKRYRFQIFHFPLAEFPARVPVLGEWLTPDEILSPQRRPISPTADFLVRQLLAEIKLRGGQFPPVALPKPNPGDRRVSEGAAAIICRRYQGEPRWLAQWNRSWRYYFFVGGHKRDDENFEQCMVREIEEELGLIRDTHYHISQRPGHFEYRAFSEGAQQDTDYKTELFLIELIAASNADAIIAAQPVNVWLSEMDIRCCRAADGRPVSPTMLTLLEKSNLTC